MDYHYNVLVKKTLVRRLTAFIVIVLFIGTIVLTIYMFTVSQKCPGVSPPEFDSASGKFVSPASSIPANDTERLVIDLLCGDSQFEFGDL